MKNNLKICVDCKYYFNDIQENFHYCTHEKNKVTKVNLVTGRNNTSYKYMIERLREKCDDDSRCGDIGRWFVDKPTEEIY